MKLHTTLVIEHGLDGRTDQNITGNVVKVFDGDAVQQALLLGDLHRTFTMKFDRGDLSVESLELVLWQSHWHLASRKAMQRAADMLILAAATDIPGSSKLARECEGLAKVLDLFVNAQPTQHPIGDALLRGEPITSSNVGILDQLYASALRADGIQPTALLTSEESQALAEQIRSTANAVEAVGAELSESETKVPSDAGSTVGAEESPFAVYEFPHEMREALRLVSETLGGIREVERLGLEPTPEMRKVSMKVLASVDELLGRVDGEAHVYRPTFVAHEKMVEEAIKYRADKKRQANIDEMQAAIVDIRQQLGLEQNAAGVTAKRTYQELERIERGLMALAKAIGPMATDQMMAAMERPA